MKIQAPIASTAIALVTKTSSRFRMLTDAPHRSSFSAG